MLSVVPGAMAERTCNAVQPLSQRRRRDRFGYNADDDGLVLPRDALLTRDEERRHAELKQPGRCVRAGSPVHKIDINEGAIESEVLELFFQFRETVERAHEYMPKVLEHLLKMKDDEGIVFEAHHPERGDRGSGGGQHCYRT